MPAFSPLSTTQLNSCHPDLVRLFTEVTKYADCTVLCGHRGQAEQDEAVRTGHSKTPWPRSKHNTEPSMAVDVVPFPIDWKDRTGMAHFAGFVQGVAAGLGIRVRWGGDWNGNFNLKDENFFDLPHFELVERAGGA